MNKSGCKDPVAETAVHNETEREHLRRKYKIHEGDVIKMRLPTRDEKTERTRIQNSPCPDQRDPHPPGHGDSSIRASGEFHMVAI